LNLPGMDGLDVCRALRRDSDIPIIMLTARIEETDRLIGLELGADDYIVKPFSPREVVARVRTVLRRAEGTPVRPEVISSAGVILDLTQRAATLNGEPLDLTTMEFDLLALLVEHPGQVFTRLQLLERTQEAAYEGYERTIDVHIKNLRKKLGDDSQEPRFIETIRGVGYRFMREAV
jgi:two-component system, OmpR family, alkaline phosphatase synthesis response regulator PhoP